MLKADASTDMGHVLPLLSGFDLTLGADYVEYDYAHANTEIQSGGLSTQIVGGAAAEFNSTTFSVGISTSF